MSQMGGACAGHASRLDLPMPTSLPFYFDHVNTTKHILPFCLCSSKTQNYFIYIRMTNELKFDIAFILAVSLKFKLD